MAKKNARSPDTSVTSESSESISTEGLRTLTKSPVRSNARERQYDIRAALYEWDPYEAHDRDQIVIGKYIQDEYKPVGQYATTLRNERYDTLSQVRSTALFAERYQSHFDDFDFDGARSGVEDGLVWVSLADFRHLWRARECADLLGMEYDDYIRGAFITLGRKEVPTPSKLHGSLAMAGAALEKQSVEMELVEAAHEQMTADIELDRSIADL